MNIGKEQSPCIVRIQHPIPIKISKRPAQEPEPAMPKPVTVPATQPQSPAGK